MFGARYRGFAPPLCVFASFAWALRFLFPPVDMDVASCDGGSDVRIEPIRPVKIKFRINFSQSFEIKDLFFCFQLHYRIFHSDRNSQSYGQLKFMLMWT